MQFPISGIYYGWAKLIDGPESNSSEVQRMVASVGTCPFYKNEKPSVEIHLIHQFAEDFYGASLNGEWTFSFEDD